MPQVPSRCAVFISGLHLDLRSNSRWPAAASHHGVSTHWRMLPSNVDLRRSCAGPCAGFSFRLEPQSRNVRAVRTE